MLAKCLPYPFIISSQLNFFFQMSYKSQIMLKSTSKFGLNLVETFETEDFKEYCTTKAYIYSRAVIKKQALQKVSPFPFINSYLNIQDLKSDEELTLDELKQKKLELKAEFMELVREFFEKGNEDNFMDYLPNLHRIYKLEALVADNIELWSQLC